MQRKYSKEFSCKGKCRQCAVMLPLPENSVQKVLDSAVQNICFSMHARINVFREMILSDSSEKRKKSLAKIQKMQKTDFYKLFKVMEGKEVTIRLMDAPLHEFLPHNTAEMDEFIAYLKKQKGFEKITKKEVAGLYAMDFPNSIRCWDTGAVRIAISYPEIYSMQINAIFEAAYTLQKEGVKVNPEIMIPIVMNQEEVKALIYGKKIEGAAIKGIKQYRRGIKEFN